MTNEQRKAIDRLKQLKDYSTTYYGSMYFKVEVKADDEMKETIDTVLSIIKEQQEEIEKYEKIYKEYDCYRWVKELDKKDKQIDLMVEYIDKIDVSEDICEGKTMCDENCKDCIKQYFAGLVEKENDKL